jgi:hypothetical protein
MNLISILEGFLKEMKTVQAFARWPEQQGAFFSSGIGFIAQNHKGFRSNP